MTRFGLIVLLGLIGLATSPSNAALITSNCGAVLSSKAVTQTTAAQVTSTTFVSPAGASATFTVPAGSTRCIKVRFIAQSYCGDENALDCFIQLTHNGVAVSPTFLANGADGQKPLSLVSEWHFRAAAGSHAVAIRWRVAAGAHLEVKTWTFDAELSK